MCALVWDTFFGVIGYSMGYYGFICVSLNIRTLRASHSPLPYIYTRSNPAITNFNQLLETCGVSENVVVILVYLLVLKNVGYNP
jgi:hypothetical protein